MNTSLRAAALLLFAGASSLGAAVVYTIGVNTSALNGQQGFVDLQFNPGNTDVDLATATISNFISNGVLAGTAMQSGDINPANAVLPASFSFINDQFGDDLFQGITFGNSLSFTLTLSGNAVSSPNPANHSGTTFAFSLYDSTGTMPLLTSGADGAVAEVNVGPNGTLSTQTFTTATNGPPAATITSTPEPATLGLLLLALSLLLVFRKFAVTEPPHTAPIALWDSVSP